MSTPDLFLRNLPAGINVFELEEWIEQQTPALGRFFAIVNVKRFAEQKTTVGYARFERRDDHPDAANLLNGERLTFESSEYTIECKLNRENAREEAYSHRAYYGWPAGWRRQPPGYIDYCKRQEAEWYEPPHRPSPPIRQRDDDHAEASEVTELRRQLADLSAMSHNGRSTSIATSTPTALDISCSSTKRAAKRTHSPPSCAWPRTTCASRTTCDWRLDEHWTSVRPRWTRHRRRRERHERRQRSSSSA